jgi:hypothetical protein
VLSPAELVAGEQSGLLMRITATEDITLFVQKKR